MKKAFLTISVFGFLVVSAQQNPLVFPKKQFDTKFKPYIIQKDRTDTSLFSMLKRFQKPQAKLSFILPDSTKGYTLPQDNMICLVPDMKQFNMPNAATPNTPFKIPNDLLDQLKNQPGRIPNATSPYLIIPQRKDTPTQ